MVPNSENTEKTEKQRTGKKPYTEPQLRVYGDVRQLTRTKGGSIRDSPGGPSSHFTV